jgi:3-hydroxyacyl-[acyl-carrier-protein] dehydratase
MRFYLVDRVDELVPGELARGVKCVTLSEDILEHHFAGQPVFPGTLVIEALAQLGGLLAEVTRNREPGEEPRRALLAQVDKAKFHEPCRPGDRLDLECRLTGGAEGAVRMAAQAAVDGRKVAGAQLTFVLRTIDQPEVHEQRRGVYRAWTRHLALSFELR